MTYFSDALTDPEMLRAADVMAGLPARTLARRLRIRGEIARQVRADLDRLSTDTLHQQDRETLAECIARLDWSRDVPY